MSSLFNAGVYAAASTITVFFVFFWRLSSFSLYGLQAYLLPDDGNGNSTPDSENKQQNQKKKKDKFVWNEGGSEILRITIGDSYLEKITYFPEFDRAVLYSALAISLLVAREYISMREGVLRQPEVESWGSEKLIPVIVICFCILKLLHILFNVSWDKYSSRRTEAALSFAVGFVGFLLSCLQPPEYVMDFGLERAAAESGADKLPILGPIVVRVVIAAGAAWLTGLLLGPAIKFVRCFWLGTNQLGWDITVVKTGVWTRFLLNLSVVLPLVTSLLWVKPMVTLFIRGGETGDWSRGFGFSPETFNDVKFVFLILSGLTQLLLLRINVQSYLNLGVLAWYESLHGSGTPDRVALKTKIVVVNHFMCRVAIQSLVPGMLVIIFAWLSRGAPGSQAGELSSALLLLAPRFVERVALFFSSWLLFSWSLLTFSILALFRFGLLLAY